MELLSCQLSATTSCLTPLHLVGIPAEPRRSPGMEAPTLPFCSFTSSVGQPFDQMLKFDLSILANAGGTPKKNYLIDQY